MKKEGLIKALRSAVFGQDQTARKRRSSTRGRQSNCERRPFPPSTFKRDRPAVGVDSALHNRQTQSGALRFASRQGQEQFIPHLLRNADASIVHVDSNRVVEARGADR